MASVADALVERCKFPQTETVTCAVSGGADSLALLVLAVRSGKQVTAVHVDHGLRDGSANEAELVRTAVARYGAAFESKTVEVEPGPNLEARAREARYSVLPPDVLVGHTADDQAETMLINLMRGAGPAGMAAMSPERRPLLNLRRHETEALCGEEGLEYFSDPMNTDDRFVRVRVRNELIPLLNEIAGRDVVEVLARQSGHFRDLNELFSAASSNVDPTDAKALAAAPAPIAAGALRQWLAGQTGGQHPPDTASVERVLKVAEGQHEATEIAGGHRVARTNQRLRVEPPESR